LFKNSQIVAPQEAPRRRSSATPHKGAFEDAARWLFFNKLLILFDIMIAAMLRNTGFGADISGGLRYGS